MNRLMLTMLMLFTVAPVMAMELMVITDKENQYFVKHLAMATAFSKKMIGQEISHNNLIYCALNKLSEDLHTCKGDLSAVIHHKDLQVHIDVYQKATESHEIVKFAEQQVLAGKGDVKYVTDYLVRTRRLVAELKLRELLPSYSAAWIGEVQTKDRIEFMQRNDNYSIEDDIAQKRYMALFIYQLLFAGRAPEDKSVLAT